MNSTGLLLVTAAAIGGIGWYIARTEPSPAPAVQAPQEIQRAAASPAASGIAGPSYAARLESRSPDAPAVQGNAPVESGTTPSGGATAVAVHDSIHHIDVDLFDAPTGGTSVWHEDRRAVTDAGRFVSFHLGAGLGRTVSDQSPLYCGILIDGKTQKMETRHAVSHLPDVLNITGYRDADAPQEQGAPPLAASEEHAPLVPGGDADRMMRALRPHAKFDGEACAEKFARSVESLWRQDSVQREAKLTKSQSTDYTVYSFWSSSDSAHELPPINKAVSARSVITNPGSVIPTASAQGAQERLFVPEPGELAPFGVVATEHGALLHYPRGSFWNIAMNGGSFHDDCGTSYPPVPDSLVLITDDIGGIRWYSYETAPGDSALNARLSTLAPGTAEHFKIVQQLDEQGKQSVLARFGTLVPVLVRTGTVYTAHDSALGLARPDLILWFAPTRQLVAALPQRVRESMERQLAAVQCKLDELAGARVDPTCAEKVAAARFSRRSGTHWAIDKRTGESVQIPLDLYYAADGAIASTMVYPNPTRGEITLNYKLTATRTLRIEVRDMGGSTRMLFTPEMQRVAGDWTARGTLQSLPTGIYQLVVRTNEGEEAVQRVVVLPR